MAIASVLDRIADGPRAYDNWRLSSRASLSGLAMVVGVQIVIGLVLALIIRLVGGFQNNAVVNLVTGGFVIGSALAGPITMLVWSLLFFNVAGIVLGLFFGTWINLPSWWHAAADQWSAGTSIPTTIFLSLIGALVLWVAASRGFAIGWSILMKKLFKSLRSRANRDQVSHEDVVRSSAAKSVLPSEAEARRAISAVDSAGEEGIILRAPSISPRSAQIEEPVAPLTQEDRSSLYEGLAGSPTDPLLAGLHKEYDPLTKPTIELAKDDVAAVTAPPQDEVVESPPSRPKMSPSREMEQRRRKLETMVEIFVDRLHSEGGDQQVIQDFVRKNASDLLSFSATDFEILAGIEGGENLIEASKNARGGSEFIQSSIEKRMENFAAAQTGSGTFEFDSDLSEQKDEALAPPGATNESLEVGPAPASSPGQEIAMGKRLTSLLRRAEAAQATEVEPEAAVIASEVPAAHSVPAEDYSAGPSVDLMSEFVPEMEIINTTAVETVMPVVADELPPQSDALSVGSSFGGRFGETVPVEEDHEITAEGGISFDIAPEAMNDIMTGSGTLIPQQASTAGSLPLDDDSKDDVMQDDILDVPVPRRQAKEIFEALTTIHVATDQVTALRALDDDYDYPVNRAILSAEFVECVGDQAASQARTRFQQIREAYLADPIESARKELDGLISRLVLINSRSLLPGDPRVPVIHAECVAFINMFNESPNLYGVLLNDAMSMMSMLEVCLTKFKGDSVVAPAPVSTRVAQAPLNKNDIDSLSDVLSSVAPTEMSDRLSKHTDPTAAHLSDRYGSSSLVGPSAEELGDSVAPDAAITDPVPPPAEPPPATESTSASDSTTGGGEVDNTDYGFLDDELDDPDPEFGSRYSEGSAIWKNARQRHDDLIDMLARARRQREARLSAEFMSLDDAAGPNDQERARFHHEMEERLAVVVRREEEAKATMDKAIAQRDEVIVDGRDLEQRKHEFEQTQVAFEEARREFDSKLAEGSVLDGASQALIDAATPMFLNVVSLPEELRTAEILRMTAEFDAVKHVSIRVISWSDESRSARQKILAQNGIEESNINRLEPCSATMRVLTVYSAYLAKRLVGQVRLALHLEPDLEASDVIKEVQDRFGDSQVVRKFVGNMAEYDDGRCNDLFSVTLEEQQKLQEYMKTPLSDLRNINQTIEDALKRAAEAEAERDSLETSVDSYRLKNERLSAQLIEAEGSPVGARPLAAAASIDDAAEALGIPRSKFAHGDDGRIFASEMLKKVIGAEVVEGWQAVMIGDKLVFPVIQGAPEFAVVYVNDEPMPIQNAAINVMSRNLQIKSWFAVGVLSELQAIVKEPGALDNVVDANFDLVVARLTS